MNTQHTPGPWKIEGAFNGPDFTIRSTDNKVIAVVPFPHAGIVEAQNPTEATANADLIAAAPELLEALKEAQKLLHPIVMKMKIKDHFHEHNVLANVIVKAIAKAEKHR